MFKGISINSACFKDYPLETALKCIHDAGYMWVELPAMKGYCEQISPHMSSNEMEEIKKLLIKYDLHISAIAAHTDFLSSQESFDWIADCISLAERLGVELVLTSPGEGDSEKRKEALKRFDTICADKKVELSLEPVGTMCSGALLGSLIDTAKTENISITYDTANVIFFGGYDPVIDIVPALNRLGNVHLKDKIGGKGEWNFPAVGEGELPMKELIDIIKAGGYTGFLTVEIEFTPDGPGSYEELDRSVNSAIKNLKAIL